MTTRHKMTAKEDASECQEDKGVKGKGGVWGS